MPKSRRCPAVSYSSHQDAKVWRFVCCVCACVYVCVCACVERKAYCEGVCIRRDATMDQVVKYQSEMEPTVFKCARHVVSENERCLKYVWYNLTVGFC